MLFLALLKMATFTEAESILKLLGKLIPRFVGVKFDIGAILKM
jgi:hypothetical protein